MRTFFIRLKGRHRVSYISLWILVFLYVCALLADFIIPYPYDLQHREYALCGPVLPHLVYNGHITRPFVYGIEVVNPAFKEYRVDTRKIYPIRFFVKGPERKVLGLIKTDRYLFGAGEGKIFLFGTDNHGRDVFSRVLYGARISLSIGVIGVTVSFILGLLIGGISGYFGGMTDTVLMRTVEIIMMFPSFYLMLALRAVFPANLSSVQVYLLIVIILSLIGWASLARIIRGMVLSIKEEEYVMAARALGLSSFRIITRHILPNTFSYTITALTLSIPDYILGESALSLLGLGIQEPYPSWGNMLSVVVGNLRILTGAPWMLIPGLFIFLTVLAFNFLGDGIREVTDPKNW
ncbi:MAG: ABC transporter permease [Candidatus Ratteibacteria bacterium]|nr:ABC transporter permease [Candidatus Ratteibacteria bacterium]